MYHELRKRGTSLRGPQQVASIDMRKLASLALTAVIVAWAGTVRAQGAYPSQPVRIIIPFPAGSTTDTLTRIVADQLNRKWGKAVVVENIPGLHIGAERVARADPDGYTLLSSPPSPLTINKLLYRDLPYDPDKLMPITLLATGPNVLDVRRDLSVNSVKELIAYAKANPGKLTYASQGVGSTAQLSTALLEQKADIKMLHVPYRGALPALNDVIAGHVDMFFDTATTSVPMFRSGQIKIIAVGVTKRIPALAEVPTMEEAGIADFRSITWFALAAPPGTPAALIARINHDTVEILKDPKVADRLHMLQLDPGATSPEETARFFADELKLWGKVIAQAHISVQ
jgi:tripartite-type tricarboxylate transporter receptor subunit TctC